MTDRGGALLAVLWLSAALSAIAFSVANTVRGEIERTATVSEGVRSYYLATSGLERARFYMGLGPAVRNPDNTARYFEPGTSRLDFNFASGVAAVEIIPEYSKLSINEIKPDELLRLLLNLGSEPQRAQEIAAAIVDWRTGPVETISLFDRYYSTRIPSFRARHASLEETEELLLVKGMTPDLFYGSTVRDAQGRLTMRAGLKDCVSIYGTTGAVDINTAQPAVLVTIGINPEVAAAIVQRRHAAPFQNAQEIAQLAQIAGPGFSRLTRGQGGTIYTLRSTARLRLQNGTMSDLTRSVSALIKIRREGQETLRWYDN